MNQVSVSTGFLLSIILFHPSIIALANSDQDSNVSSSGIHRHRHNHNHHRNGLTSNAHFVAAYRAMESQVQQEIEEEQESQDNESEEENQGSSSVESRLANLEMDVRRLCLEDEEDVERKVRELGVKCICPTVEAPVCGSDNVTYWNRCYLHCRAQQAEMGYHRYKITLKKFGRC